MVNAPCSQERKDTVSQQSNSLDLHVVLTLWLKSCIWNKDLGRVSTTDQVRREGKVSNTKRYERYLETESSDLSTSTFDRR